ncbi:hypothetical protein [Achromobacter spanius]|uniref:hypothetical protein n=1 Tax=Achromobacter spanius TaxID=217203 RepID=UPI003A927EB2
MAIDLEPKDGDFARYIENLSRAGGVTPGKVPEKGRASRQASVAVPVPVPAPASGDSLSTAPWGNTAPPSRSTGSPGSTAPSDAAEISMAQRARQRKFGVILTVGGVLAGWAAANIAFRVLRTPHFELDELMPAVFLGFFAVMLLKAAGNARKARGTPLGKLPPLKTSSYRKDN